MTGQQVHRSATRIFSFLMVLIGVALIVEAVAGAGNVVSLLLFGVLFIAAGAARLYLETKRARDSS